jgi:predicted Zn-dependent peptidase
MMRKLSFAFFAAALVSAWVPARADAPPSAAPAGAAGAAAITPPDLPIDRSVLPNGLEVLVHEDHRTPIVTVDVWYHVGSKDEPQGRNGFAHLFEHMMFQGSKHVPEDTYFLQLERAGASDVNGYTTDDRTAYHETVPRNRLELALWLESDRMGFLLDHVDQASFQGQVKVVKQERAQNYENRPYGLVDQYIRAALFPATHPYHRITIGTTEDLDAANVEDVKAFFRTWYLPNNATIAVVGDVTAQEAKDLVAKYFGPIPSGPAPQHVTAPLPQTASETRLDVGAGVELPRVDVDWVSAPAFAPGDAELEVLSDVLAHGKTSRLYKRLVYDMQIAQSVSATQDSMQLASVFEIEATARQGHTGDELLQVIDDELAKLRAQGIQDDEIGRATTGWAAQTLFALESVGERAERFQFYNQFAHDPGFLPKDFRNHMVTAQQVADAARRWLPARARVVTVVTPTPGAPLAGTITRTSTPGSRP